MVAFSAPGGEMMIPFAARLGLVALAAVSLNCAGTQKASRQSAPKHQGPKWVVHSLDFEEGRQLENELAALRGAAQGDGSQCGFYAADGSVTGTVQEVQAYWRQHPPIKQRVEWAEQLGIRGELAARALDSQPQISFSEIWNSKLDALPADQQRRWARALDEVSERSSPLRFGMWWGGSFELITNHDEEDADRAVTMQCFVTLAERLPELWRQLSETRDQRRNGVSAGDLPDTYEVFDALYTCARIDDSPEHLTDQCAGSRGIEYARSKYEDGVPGFPAKGCEASITSELDAATKSQIRSDEDDRQFGTRIQTATELRASFVRVMNEPVENMSALDIDRVASWFMGYGAFGAPCRDCNWNRNVVMKRRVESYAAQYPKDSPVRREPCVAKFLHRTLAWRAMDEKRELDRKAAFAESQAQTANERERRDVLARRFRPIVIDCSKSWRPSDDRCSSLPGLSDAERNQCQMECADAAKNSREKAVGSAAYDCAVDGKVCAIQPPEGASIEQSQLREMNQACKKDCASRRAEDRQSTVAARKADADDKRECVQACAAEKGECSQACSGLSTADRCRDDCRADLRQCEIRCVR